MSRHCARRKSHQVFVHSASNMQGVALSRRGTRHSVGSTLLRLCQLVDDLRDAKPDRMTGGNAVSFGQVGKRGACSGFRRRRRRADIGGLIAGLMLGLLSG
jgi:hypothetical protein